MGQVKQWLEDEPEVDVDDYDSELRVGMGATVPAGSDRYPYTIIEISKSGKRVTIQADGYERIDKNGFSESQEYKYYRNPNGATMIVSLRKDGKWRQMHTGQYVHLGSRRAYQDPHF